MSPRAIAVGEALIDEFPDRRVVAGAPLHVLAHLAALGWETAMITRLGRDADADSIVDAMAAAGVSTALVETDETLPTGTTTITLLPEGGHTFAVNAPAAWDAIVGPDPVPDHEVVVFGTLALRDPRTRHAVDRIAAAPGFVVVDLNLRPPHYDATTVAAALDRADLVKATAEEEHEVTSLLGVPSLFTSAATWVCITRGADGASLHHRSGERWDVPAKPTSVVDAVGAGDAFLAGLIDGLVVHRDPLGALRGASHLAADTLSRRGGMPAPRKRT